MPEPDYNGELYVASYLNDGQLSSDTLDLELHIIPINDPPILIELLPDVSINEDDFGAVIIPVLEDHFSDIDEQDILIFTANALDAGLDSLVISNFNLNNMALFFNYTDGEIITLKRSDVKNMNAIDNIAGRVIGNNMFSNRSNSTVNHSLSIPSMKAGNTSRTLGSTTGSRSDSTALIVYPTENFVGDIRIVLMAMDTSSESVTDTMLLTIESINDPPEAFSVEVITDEDVPIEIILDGFDVEESPLTFIIVDSSVNGTYSNNIYTPIANFHGLDSFTFIANDGEINSEIATVEITINAINDPPLAYDLYDTTNQNNPITLELTAFDIDDDSLTYEIIDSTSNGNLSGQLPLLTYTPFLNYSGSDLFQFRVMDSNYSDTANYNLTINSVNQAPVAIAGDDIFALQGMSILLDGSQSFDIDNEVLYYHWQAPSILNLQDTTSQNIIVNVPTLDSGTTLLITLTVYDGYLYSLPDSLFLFIENEDVTDILPEIPADSVQPGQDLSIGVGLPEYFIVDSISLNYSDGENFNSIAMEQSGRSFLSGQYRADIPGTDISHRGLVYFVYAEDIIDNYFSTDTVNIPVNFESGTLTSEMDGSAYPNGLQEKVWRLISVPGILNESSVEGIFESTFEASPSEYNWRLYHWDDPDWYEPINVEPGKSYWIQQRITPNVVFSLGSGNSADLNGIVLQLAPGWNMISSPYTFPVDIQYDPDYFTEPFVYGSHNGEGWLDTTISSFIPWGGYAIFNKMSEEKEFNIEPLNTQDYGVARIIADSKGWTMKVRGSGNNYSDQKNKIGRISNASNTMDEYDLPEPPNIGNYISIFSQQSDEFSTYNQLSSDIRALNDFPQEWDIHMMTKNESGNIKLTFIGEGEIVDEEIWLLDIQEKDFVQIPFFEPFEYVIKSYTEKYPVRLKVISGPGSSIPSLIETIFKELPGEFSIGNNYPNPFNSKTSIPYTVSRPTKVQMIVYDLNGKEIIRLIDEIKDMGDYIVTWSGVNSSGYPVSSGVYFVTLKMDYFYNTKKMILIK